WFTQAITVGATPPTTVQAFSGSVATSISPMSRSIARTTARPTCCEVRWPEPGGIFTPLSANIPASRIGPGNTHETPTPVPRRSWRNPDENPRRPNFVAEYRPELAVATFPDSDDMNTT